MEHEVHSREEVRALSRIFSTAFLVELIDIRARHNALDRLQCVRKEWCSGCETIGEVLSCAYSLMVELYRNEHVFKEAVTQWWINRSGNRSNVGMVFEVRSGPSKLDVLCGIGLSHALEIKTDFDRPTRLFGQLSAYYARFPRVSLVVSDRRLARFQSLISAEVGLISVSEKGGASVVREPVARFDALNKPSMISLLRSDEVVSLGASLGCDLTATPNTRLKSELLRCTDRLDSGELSDMIARFVGRRSDRIDAFSVRLLPRGVRSLAIKMNLSEHQYMKLQEALVAPL